MLGRVSRRSILLQVLLSTLGPLSGTAEERWREVAREAFDGCPEKETVGESSWIPDPIPTDGPFSDGDKQLLKGHSIPEGYRAKVVLGTKGWLVAELYTRAPGVATTALLSTAPREGAAGNCALQVRSLESSDAVVLKPAVPLPSQYRVCVDVGLAHFGSGDSKRDPLNGYRGGERGEPWRDYDATLENGFYWLAILDHIPRPHNNVWIHHHRKVVIDSDNNQQQWTEIWHGESFVPDGRHPVMMFGVSSFGLNNFFTGMPFISLAQNVPQPHGLIRATDAYREDRWYRTCVAKTVTVYRLTVEGEFQWGGKRLYRGELPLAEVYHASSHPDYFMLGDPHINFYRGQVQYDNLTLEVPS